MSRSATFTHHPSLFPSCPSPSFSTMTVQGYGSENSPIVVSDDEEAASVERQLGGSSVTHILWIGSSKQQHPTPDSYDASWQEEPSYSDDVQGASFPFYDYSKMRVAIYLSQIMLQYPLSVRNESAMAGHTLISLRHHSLRAKMLERRGARRSGSWHSSRGHLRSLRQRPCRSLRLYLRPTLYRLSHCPPPICFLYLLYPIVPRIQSGRSHHHRALNWASRSCSPRYSHRSSGAEGHR